MFLVAVTKLTRANIMNNKRAFLVVHLGKNLPATQETPV